MSYLAYKPMTISDAAPEVNDLGECTYRLWIEAGGPILTPLLGLIGTAPTICNALSGF